MARQIMKLTACGKWYTVQHHPESPNAYWLYEHWLDSCLPTEHRKRVAQYANMNSFFCYLAQDMAFYKEG